MDRENFVKEYKKLCEKYNLHFIAEPFWVRRDDGTYSTVVQFSLRELNPPQEISQNANK